MAATSLTGRTHPTAPHDAAPVPARVDDEGSAVDLQVSTDVEDGEWDDFLERSPLGHFQQSAAWARYKATEGWSVMRAVYRVDHAVVGGMQLLWRPTRVGRLAYVSKGPVLDERFASLAGAAVARIKQMAAEARLAAVIVQPPDDSGPDMLDAVARERFVPCSFLGVVESTLLVALSTDTARLARSYRRTTRNERNQAMRAGLVVRDGDETDVPEFFRLMRMSCRRQRVHPNPPTEDSVRALWQSLNTPRTRAHLKFTVVQGETVGGDLTIVFGRRATLFKTGWDGRHAGLYPNSFRVCETIEWAAAAGHQLFDFAAFDRDLADCLRHGQKVTPELNRRRDAFKARYGGYPKLLPPASLWIRNPVARLCFLSGTHVPLVRQMARRVIG